LGEDEKQGVAALRSRARGGDPGSEQPQVSNIEAESRLRSVREVLEHERHALTRLDDDRLDVVVQAMEELEAAIVIALTLLEQPPRGGS
jgi:hypothetical protein